MLFLVGCTSCAIFNGEGLMAHKRRTSVGIISSKTFLEISTKTATNALSFTSFYNNSGTGTIIKHNRETSFILTAAHICTIAYDKQIQSVFPFYNRIEYNASFRRFVEIYDIRADKRQAIALVWSKQYDLCIMVTLKIDLPALNLSYSPPYPGEKIYYIGFPRGIGGGGFTPIFEGFYLGIMQNGKMSRADVAGYSVPIAPGSSGSAVLNANGDIIGVLHSYFPIFEHIGLSATHKQVESILEEAEKVYEESKVPILKELNDKI